MVTRGAGPRARDAAAAAPGRFGSIPRDQSRAPGHVCAPRRCCASAASVCTLREVRAGRAETLLAATTLIRRFFFYADDWRSVQCALSLFPAECGTAAREGGGPEYKGGRVLRDRGVMWRLQWSALPRRSSVWGSSRTKDAHRTTQNTRVYTAWTRGGGCHTNTSSDAGRRGQFCEQTTTKLRLRVLQIQRIASSPWPPSSAGCVEKSEPRQRANQRHPPGESKNKRVDNAVEGAE
jgi:hypothetical protein